MVTMLATDIAGGAFGRTLAALGGEASGEATSTADVQEKRTRSEEAKRNLEDKLIESRVIKNNLEETKKEKEEIEEKLKAEKKENTRIAGELDDTDSSTPSEEVKELEENLEKSDKKVSSLEESYKAASEREAKLESDHKESEESKIEAEDNYTSKLKAQAKSEAKATFAAAGAITRTQNPEVAKSIATIHKQFLDDFNMDALMVACVSALDKGADKSTMLATVCNSLLTSEGFVKMLTAR